MCSVQETNELYIPPHRSTTMVITWKIQSLSASVSRNPCHQSPDSAGLPSQDRPEWLPGETGAEQSDRETLEFHALTVWHSSPKVGIGVVERAKMVATKGKWDTGAG